MALTPETADALKQALEAVIEECGDTPGYEDLVAKLQDAEQAIPDTGDMPAERGGDHADAEGEDDAYSFEHAERKHKAARKAKKDDGGNPFAKDEE